MKFRPLGWELATVLVAVVALVVSVALGSERVIATVVVVLAIIRRSYSSARAYVWSLASPRKTDAAASPGSLGPEPGRPLRGMSGRVLGQT